ASMSSRPTISTMPPRRSSRRCRASAMRAGLAAIAVLALCVTPVAAQGKTKPGAVPQSVQALEMCETFAAGDVLAVEAAIEKGWDAYDDGGESPYVRSYSGS